LSASPFHFLVELHHVLNLHALNWVAVTTGDGSSLHLGGAAGAREKGKGAKEQGLTLTFIGFSFIDLFIVKPYATGAMGCKE